jgi:diguanylate cyclase (GGDEF)-like protein/PAS domain S-box-containing protein
MRQDIEALNQLARIATQGFADEETLTQAASIIRQATGAAEAVVVYAQDKNFLTCSDAGDGPPTELTLAALTMVQRHAAQTNEPVAFNLVGHWVGDFTSALSDDAHQFLAFTVPTTESASEMCILRGDWEHKARARILPFMQSATPALTIMLERFLNANRSQRLGEQLQTLANAAQMLTRSEDVEAALRDLATAISASTGFEYIVNIDLYDATTNRFFLRVLSEQRYTGGTLGKFWGAGLNPDRIDPWNAEVMTTLKPALRPDMQNDPVYPEHVRKFFAQSLLRSTADFPLLFQDEFLGTVAFVSFKPRTFPPDEVSLLQGFAAQVATAVKALQMHKEVERYAQELRRSADQYIATTNLTGDVICRLDKRGRWTFLNDSACQFFGKPREELLGTDSRAPLHPDDVELTAQAIRQMRANRKPVSGFVNRHVTPMGTRVVEWNGYPLFDEEGQYVGIQITGRDITERKRMEDALAAKTKEYIATTNLTGDIIGKVDKHGRYTFLNDAACEFLGRPREELLGTDSRAFVHPDDLEPIDQAIRQTMNSKNLLRGAVGRLVTPMGTRVVEWNGYPLFDEDGQYVGIQITGRDITERKQLEEQREKALHDMGERMKELACMYRVTDLSRAAQTMEEFLQDAVTAIPPGWQYPEVTRAKLSLDGQEYVSQPFQETPWKQSSDIVIRGEKRGVVEVYYLEERPELDEGPFTQEERNLIDGLARVLSEAAERKQMEEALRESEARYKALFAGAPQGMLVADPQTRQFRYANPALCMMFGYTEEELLRLGVADIHPKESLDHALADFEAQVRGEKPLSPALPCLRKDGTLFYADIRSIAIVLDGRRCSVGIFSDVTERKRAEEALRESEEKWRSLAQNAPNIILIVDRDGTIQFINRTVSGMTVEETLGRNAYDFVQPEYHRTMRKSIEQLFQTGDVGTYQVIGAGPGGRPSWYETQFGPIKRGGQVVAATLITTDITERKRAEEALRESEEAFRLLFENAKDAIFHADPATGLITKCNRAAETLLEKDREEIIGQPQRTIHPPQKAEHYIQMFKRHIEQQGFAEDEAEVITKSGKTKPVLITTSVASVRGTPIIQGAFRDITERKQMEAERERLHAELEVRAITDSLTGLYNHAHFYQRLAEEIERSRRYKRRFAVVMMDVDAFKHYNDSRGHQAGDDALRLLADCIRSGIRGSDLAFRYGGDEFAAILLNADSSRAQTVVNRINRCIAAGLKKMDDQAAAWLGLSAGVASFPGDATTTDELVKMADAALYNAKRLAWARGLTQPEQAIESQAYPHKLLHETQAGMLTTAAGSLATVLQDLGVSDVAAALDLRAIAAVGAAAEIKDRYIRGHQERASLWAAALAGDMGLSSEQVRNIRIAGLLHDIGKVTINDGILNKPGKLTEEEFAKVKRHAPIGAEIMLSEAEALQQMAAIVRYHHERFDGKGYPDGIAGELIPLEARIMSVVDVFDAMTHERSYRKALSKEEAIAELEHGAGTQFDPAVVKAFLALLKRRSDEPAAPAQAASADRRLSSAKVAAGRKA